MLTRIGKLDLFDKEGNLVRRISIKYWNAKNDEEPCLYIHLGELMFGLEGGIVLPLKEAKEEINK